ncbi:hypothetical protein FDECE_10486 [Fusarium decemcellulare]|nr:hypothetical protein FDECE_10486 [Fusarium decemcellulare]
MVPRGKTTHARPRFIPVACRSCAKSKTRCDHLFPCGRCSTKGIACVPRTPRRAGAGGVTASANPSSNAVVSIGTPNNAHVTTHDAGIETSPGEVVVAPDLYRARSPSEAEVTIPAPQNEQHSTSSHDLEPRPEDPMGPNSPSCALDTDFDMSVFLTLGDADLDANLDWTRFLGSVSADMWLPGHITADNGRPLSGFEIPLNTPSAPVDPRLNHDPEQRTPVDLSVDTEVLSSGRAPDGDISPGDNQHSIQSPTPGTTIDNPTPSSHDDYNHARHGTDYWIICRCTPCPIDTAPIQSGENIAHLGENLAFLTSVAEGPEDWRREHFESHEMLDKVPLTDSSRERLLVVMQTFFRWARELHGLNRNPRQADDQSRLSLRGRNSIGFLLLPPTLVLHTYLEKYLTSFEPFYPIVPQMSLDPNTLLQGTSESMSALLLVLVIAYGMMRDENAKGQRLSTGMIELCKVALTNFVERETQMPRSRLTFHCALLWTLEAAFSGDKHLMDLSQGQRYNFLGMARFYGVFKPDNPLVKHSPENCGIWDRDESQWRYGEYRARLAYSWVLLDQEISIFYDDTPILPIAELEIALPQRDDIWLEKSATLFSDTDNGSSGSSGGHYGVSSREMRTHSLSELFQLFLEDKLDHLDEDLQVLHMRLLLHPIQTLIYHRCQLMQCLPQIHTLNQSSRTPFRTSSAIQLAEIKCLLTRWHDIMNRLDPKDSTRHLASKQVALIIYHLINLDIHISIPEIERISREEIKEDMNCASVRGLFSHFSRFIYAIEEALMHCGQILRFIKQLDTQMRPLWSSLAIYRVAIALWAIGNAFSSSIREPMTHGRSPAHANPKDPIAIDVQPAEEIPWRRVLSNPQFVCNLSPLRAPIPT